MIDCICQGFGQELIMLPNAMTTLRLDLIKHQDHDSTQRRVECTMTMQFTVNVPAYRQRRGVCH